MNSFDDFTRLYPLNKTLRFELKPVGKTLENFMVSGLLEEDQHRADSYVKVKNIIDDYHKQYIEEQLSKCTLKEKSTGEQDSLEDFFVCYKEKDNIDLIQKNLREQIVKSLTSDERYKRIDKKELIQQDLLEFIKANTAKYTEEDNKLIEEFRNFTTYFIGFHENRKNMYSNEAKSTAIAFRLIHENLLFFIDNIFVFQKVAMTAVAQHFEKLFKDTESFLNVSSIGEIFELSYYNKVLAQSQIDIYNMVIGGRTLEDGTKIQGLNEYINLFNQQQKNKSDRLPKLKPLYKQILSDRNTISWLPQSFSSDTEVLEAIEKFYQELNAHVFQTSSSNAVSLPLLLQRIDDYDLARIYVCNDAQLSDISKRLYGDWGFIQQAFHQDYAKRHPKTKRKSEEQYELDWEKYWKNKGCLSLQEINEVIKDVHPNSDVCIPVQRYFSSLGGAWDGKDISDKIGQIEVAYSNVKDFLCTDYPTSQHLSQDKIAIEGIKKLLDALNALLHFVKPLLIDEAESDKDAHFYGDLLPLWDTLLQLVPLYNMVRNYVTKKPYSIEKIKLNFGNSTLLAGWDLNKERDNTSVILRKDGLYYLGIMNKKWNKILDRKTLPNEGECFEKMEYKQISDPKKNLIRVFFAKKNIHLYSPSENIKRIRKNKTYTKEKSNLKDCQTLIDFFKSSIEKHKDWNRFGFEFSNTSQYENINDFYREVERQGYHLSFVNVSAKYVQQMVDEGKLYLFQIYNKDFSPYSKGTPNLHTLYWKMLFDDSNLQDVVYKLNGGAEVFFRKASLDYKYPTHPANQPIANKNIHNPKAESTFEYDLVKDKRFTVDKFQFHVPITLNFKNQAVKDLNAKVKGYLHETDDIHIIGIDRGERHLLYLSIIDMHGHIVKQYTLNDIVNVHHGIEYHTDYHQLLDVKEHERKEARQSWQTIENIKELKEGYLSQVVHKISQLMVEYKAIVVLEDLNFGFMRGRQKVEKQVYQKFEKMLIDKLNYLVDKNESPEKIGGLLNAYQLTSKFESFQKLGKQSGFLFYVPAWMTSKIDPVTGFVNLFDLRYENKEKCHSFFSNFEEIRYNADKDWFEFDFDYSKFTGKAEGTRLRWCACSHGTRILTFRNIEKNSQWDNLEIDLTAEFKRLFDYYQLNWHDDLKNQILSQNEVRFYENKSRKTDEPFGLLQLFRLLMQMRNSVTGTDIDYLISPVADADGNIYDSRSSGEYLPDNADANGAYNIARKGLWLVQQIKKTENIDSVKLAISNKEWLRFVQQHNQ